MMHLLHPATLACLRSTECLAAVAAALMSAELLAERRLLHPAHPAAWARHPHPRVDRALGRIGLHRLFGYRATLFVLTLRLATALLVIASVLTARESLVAPRVALLLLLLVTLVWHLRGRALLMGSDQFCLMVVLTATAAEWLGTSAAYSIALTFLAALAALLYGTTGLAKARMRGWRDGQFVRYICSTESHGNAGFSRVLRRWPWLAATASVATVMTECLLCIAWLLPPQVCLAVLSAGLLLHAGIARLTGLNTYMWAFVASYPATFFVSTCLWNLR